MPGVFFQVHASSMCFYQIVFSVGIAGIRGDHEIVYRKQFNDSNC